MERRRSDIRYPHGLTLEEWRAKISDQALLDDPKFREYTYSHWDQGNPPDWALHYWKKENVTRHRTR